MPTRCVDHLAVDLHTDIEIAVSHKRHVILADLVVLGQSG
jgi:hypothetical protein